MLNNRDLIIEQTNCNVGFCLNEDDRTDKSARPIYRPVLDVTDISV